MQLSWVITANDSTCYKNDMPLCLFEQQFTELENGCKGISAGRQTTDVSWWISMWEKPVSYVFGHILTFLKNPFNLFYIHLLNTSDMKLVMIPTPTK